MPGLKPSRFAGPVSGPSVWVDPPPAVELTESSSRVGYAPRLPGGKVWSSPAEFTRARNPCPPVEVVDAVEAVAVGTPELPSAPVPDGG
jgi:hypothetical protein